jgi:hypothetical protein
VEETKMSKSRDRKPELVTKERAEQAALKFHQLTLVAWMKEDKFAEREARMIREFLSDCTKLLPTKEKMLWTLE